MGSCSPLWEKQQGGELAHVGEVQQRKLQEATSTSPIFAFKQMRMIKRMGSLGGPDEDDPPA